MKYKALPVKKGLVFQNEGDKISIRNQKAREKKTKPEIKSRCYRKRLSNQNLHFGVM